MAGAALLAAAVGLCIMGLLWLQAWDRPLSSESQASWSSHGPAPVLVPPRHNATATPGRGAPPAQGAAPDAFDTSRWVRRQRSLWEEVCVCEREAMQTSIPRLYEALPQVLVLDLRGAAWNGLGNSLPRWLDLLRFGVALGRATFLLFSDCSLDDRAGTACKFDLGEYYETQSGVRWQWNAETSARVEAAMRARGVRRTERRLCNYTEAQVSRIMNTPHPECTVRSKFPAGGKCHYGMCLNDTYDWLMGPARDHPYLFIDQIGQLDASMFAALRRRLGGDCSDEQGRTGHARTYGCPQIGWLKPTRALRAALVPKLAELERFDAVVTLHFRSRFVDFAGQEHTAWERSTKAAFRPDVTGWTPSDFVDGIEEILQECPTAWADAPAPCAVHHVSGAKHQRDHLDDRLYEDPRQCGAPMATFELKTRHGGPISRAMTCAGRLAATVASGAEGGQLKRPGVAEGRAASNTFWPRGGRWGLFVMSDSPALMQFVRVSEALAGRAVQTSGVFAHNTYGQVCAGKDARGQWVCHQGRDPGGGWTRIVMDHYLASLTDGLVGLPQSTFQDAVLMNSMTAKLRFVSFHFITQSWTRREFRDGIVRILQGDEASREAARPPGVQARF